jgi:hypothetical protein
MQRPTTIDYDKAIKEVLREGGWNDLDAITNSQSSLAQPNPGLGVAALQNLTAQLPQ